MIARPQAAEAAPYYFTYINHVPEEDVLGILERQLDESVKLFSRISDAQSLHRYAPDKWSIRQVVSHLSDCERLFVFRAFWFARGFETPLPSFDQHTAASRTEADKIPWAAHIEEFRRVRLATVSFFKNLPPEAWSRSGVASDNLFTVRALAFVAAGHFIHHTKILRERYL